MGQEPETIFVKKEFFPDIQTGRKTIDIRVTTPKIRRKRVGEEVIIACSDGRVKVRFTAIRKYDDFDATMMVEDPEQIAPGKTKAEILIGLREFYTPEQEALGVTALHIELVPSTA